MEQDLAKRDFRELIELDYFRLIDQKIISDLVQAVAARTVTGGDVALWVRGRRQSHWYGEYRHLYKAVEYAAEFMPALDEARLTMESLPDGVRRYSRVWYRLDQLYRKFIHHVRMSGQASLMGGLTEQIENRYTNHFLLKVNDRWQSYVDRADRWEALPVSSQEQHLTIQENQKGISFDTLLGPYLRGASKITVTDPYIRLFYQTRNFMELLETIVNLKSPDEEVSIHLVTTEDDFRGEQQQENFEKIKESSGAVGIHFTWEFDGTGTIHARHIVTDHGWKILLDRGLDIFQPYEMNAAICGICNIRDYLRFRQPWMAG
jgi:hypothetical protein